MVWLNSVKKHALNLSAVSGSITGALTDLGCCAICVLSCFRGGRESGEGTVRAALFAEVALGSLRVGAFTGEDTRVIEFGQCGAECSDDWWFTNSASDLVAFCVRGFVVIALEEGSIAADLLEFSTDWAGILEVYADFGFGRLQGLILAGFECQSGGREHRLPPGKRWEEYLILAQMLR